MRRGRQRYGNGRLRMLAGVKILISLERVGRWGVSTDQPTANPIHGEENLPSSRLVRRALRHVEETRRAQAT